MILNGRMLIILVKTTANTNNSILAKSIADTNTNTFVTIFFAVYYIQQRVFFHGHLLIKLSEQKHYKIGF